MDAELKRILLVENDIVTSNLISRNLRDLYDVTVASNADEALMLVNEQKFDGFLMDIHLGRGMSGVKLTQLIKEIPGYEKTPFIAVTAFAMREEREEFLANGLTHYISKPFKRQELIDLLDSIFGKTG
jgi:CheY-like chemotaxis protein